MKPLSLQGQLPQYGNRDHRIELSVSNADAALKLQLYKKWLAVCGSADASSASAANSSLLTFHLAYCSIQMAHRTLLSGIGSPAIGAPAKHVARHVARTIDTVELGLRPKVVQACPK